MGPKKAKQASFSQSIPDLSQKSDNTSADASQDVDMINIQGIMRQHKQRVKSRRIKGKADLEAFHQKQKADLDGEVVRAVQQHKERIRSIRRPKVERLIELVRKKRQLEDKIDQCQSQLESAYLSAARQLQIAIDGRAEELVV